tara:strand:- start:2798 stop:3184 length:387 start_codon:yes stop_codon:yes gene_type:complete
MQSNYVDHRTTLQKNRSNSCIDSFKNYVKINNDEDQFGKIKLEINFKKGSKILIRCVNIYRKNLINILEKFKNSGFEIKLAQQNEDGNAISNVAPQMINSNHPEYQTNTVGFMRNSYQSSYNQKFNMK